MATYVKFYDFVEELAKGTHQLAAAGHVVKAYLTNNAPSQSADAIKTDLAGITEGAGFGYDPIDIENDVSRTDGVAKMTAVDKTWTASGGSFGPFRYVVLYNDTAADDNLICYWDYGSAITVADGETFTINFGTEVFTIE